MLCHENENNGIPVAPDAHFEDDSATVDGDSGPKIDLELIQRFYEAWVIVAVERHWVTQREHLVLLREPYLHPKKDRVVFTFQDTRTRNIFHVTGFLDEKGHVTRWEPGIIND